MSPSEYPRPTSRDGVATPDTQPNTTVEISITTLIRIRQEKIMFSFQNKKVLLPGHDARKNPCHTSECGGRNTPSHVKCSKWVGTWQGKIRYYTYKSYIKVLSDFYGMICACSGLFNVYYFFIIRHTVVLLTANKSAIFSLVYPNNSLNFSIRFLNCALFSDLAPSE